MQILPWLVLLAGLVIVVLVYLRYQTKIKTQDENLMDNKAAQKKDGDAAKAKAKTIPKTNPAMPRELKRLLIVYLLVFGSGLVFMLVSLNSLDFPEAVVIPQPREVIPPAPAAAPAVAAPAAAAPAVAAPVVAAPAAAARQVTVPVPSPTPVAPTLLQIFAESKGGSPPTLSLTAYGNNFTTGSKVRFNMQPVASTYISENLISASLPPALSVGVGAVAVDVVNPGGTSSSAITVPIEKPRVALNIFFLWYPWITREVQLLLLAILAGALGSYLHAIMSLADFIADRSLKESWFWWYISRPFLGMAMALIFYAMLRGGFLAGSPADARVVNPFGVLAIGALVGMFSDKSAQKLGEVFDVVFRSSGAARPDKLGESAVMPPEITARDGSLHDAIADTDYEHSLNASEGTPPYTWSLVTSPAWLKIDPTTGILSGLPGSQDVNDINKVTVKVVDEAQASGEATFNLKVTQGSGSPP